jgi:hypothetical protein
MASRLEILMEAEKRGLLTPQHQGILDEARKRGLVPTKEAKPMVPLSTEEGHVFISNEELKAQAKASKRANDAWKEGRGAGERIADTAAFAGSVIPRTITRGQYGLGDIVGAVSPEAGKSIAEGERDFAQANREGLEAVAAFGEVTAGIPFLNTMGAPIKGATATARMAAANPRGTVANLIEDTHLGRTSAGQRATAAAQSALTPKAKPQAPASQVAPANIQSLPDRLRDMQAFRELEMEPFAPAMASKGTARLARTIEELPVVGGTVKAAKERAEMGARDVQQGIGRDLGAPVTEEAAGQMLQAGLERYRTRGIEDIDPAALRAQGIEPYQPQPAAQIMSNEAAQRAPQAAAIRQQAGQSGTAQTSRGATVPAARPLNQLGLRRTNAEDLSEPELGQLIRAPSRATSFGVRSEALYESAWRKMPNMNRADGSVNPNRLSVPNLRQALGQVVSQIGSQIAGQNTLAGSLAQRIGKAGAHFSFEEIRAIRTELGRALGNFGQFDIGLDRTQLKSLYGALSRDMEVGLQDLANRAWIGTKRAPGAKDYVSPAVARKADAALYEFRRADRYTRLGMERMDRFMSVLNAKTPDQAARSLIKAVNEKTANVGLVREVSRVLRPNEWDAVRGYIFQQLGRGRAGAQEAETIFNWSHWATDFHKMMDAPAGRELLTQGLPADVTRRLENLARVVNRMKYYETTKNFSGSMYTGGAGIALLSPSIMTTAAALFGSSAIMGKLLTSRPYTAWLESFMQAQMRVGNTAAANARITAQHARRLMAVAARQKDPELAKAMQAFGLALSQNQNHERIAP